MSHGYSAIILAGGDRTRLRSLTQRLAGDDRPKQFCHLIGDRSLLTETRRRVGRLIPPEHLLTVVVRRHERFYEPELCGAAPGTVVVQPENCGTAPAILYALSRLAITAPTRPVAIVPSDHYVSDDDAFMARVQSALDTTQVQAERVILLGIEPDRPETEYGWIEPGELLLGQSWPLYAVKRFWEKPPAPVAAWLARAGCFWNSFVIVAHPATLQDLIRAAVPRLAAAFEPLVARLGTAWEDEAARTVYAPLPAIDFSKRVLQARSAKLAVFPVSGFEWNDLGDPARVCATQWQTRRNVASA